VSGRSGCRTVEKLNGGTKAGQLPGYRFAFLQPSNMKERTARRKECDRGREAKKPVWWNKRKRPTARITELRMASSSVWLYRTPTGKDTKRVKHGGGGGGGKAMR